MPQKGDTVSLKPATQKRVRTLGALGIAGVAAALLLQPVSGADFTASDNGRVDVSTAQLTLSLSDDNGSSDSFDLDFTNLKPGETLTQSFYATNTGSIAGDVSFAPANPLNSTLTGGQLTAGDYAELTVAIPGHLKPTRVDQLPASISLGSLVAGESKGFPLEISLASSAGNEWQNVTLGADATVTLKQR